MQEILRSFEKVAWIARLLKVLQMLYNEKKGEEQAQETAEVSPSPESDTTISIGD